MNKILSLTTLMILIMDPLGNLPIFISILKHIEPKLRKIIIIRELFIALLLMLIFLFIGNKILLFLNLRPEAVSISGSIVLFLIATRMIFHNTENSANLLSSKEPFIVPLATPLVAGPSILATLISLSHQYSGEIEHLIIALLLAWSITFAILLQSSLFLNLLGKKGVNALEQIMGLILVIIAIQMFLDGIWTWIKGENLFLLR